MCGMKRELLFRKKVRILKYFQIVGTSNEVIRTYAQNILFGNTLTGEKNFTWETLTTDLKSFFNRTISIYFSVSDIN